MQKILQIMQQKFDALSKEHEQLEMMTTDWTDEQFARVIELDIILELLEENIKALSTTSNIE